MEEVEDLPLTSDSTESPAACDTQVNRRQLHGIIPRPSAPDALSQQIAVIVRVYGRYDAGGFEAHD
ncbi:hypothetical protein BD410DRAFT_843335 [Rickenella mellea]|uniref:Uncharacterized protein n=1 Tax=Rickenella mellea TaxID=50990 RepID=A0A4Y7PSE3_9AGAM|nr:hypothetical protein BD410DRAFT_843335 [Rickenella mellea]